MSVTSRLRQLVFGEPKSFQNLPLDTSTQIWGPPPEHILHAIEVYYKDGNGAPAVPSAGTLTAIRENDGTEQADLLAAGTFDCSTIGVVDTVEELTISTTTADKMFATGDWLVVQIAALTCHAEGAVWVRPIFLPAQR